MARSDEVRRGPGRPTAKNPLNYQLYVRLTETDGQRLDNLADRLNRDRADLIREMILTMMKKMEETKVIPINEG